LIERGHFLLATLALPYIFLSIKMPAPCGAAKPSLESLL
jgi:hypothetical protein